MFLTSSLDVISSVITSLQGNAQPLIESSNLISVMTSCMQDNDTEVRQSAFALLGDISQHCFPVVANFSKQYIALCVEHMNIE